MMKRLFEAWLAVIIAIVIVGSPVQAQQRGASAKRPGDVGRRLERESLRPPNPKGGGEAWPLGRINGRLGQRVDSRLDLRISSVQPIQGNKQQNSILQQAQGNAATDPK